MEKVHQMFWVNMDPSKMNRSHRKAFKKEVLKTCRLQQIYNAFFKAMQSDAEIDYQLIFGFYNGEFKVECERLINLNNFRYIVLNHNYIQEVFGYDKNRVRPKTATFSILDKIRKFSNRH